MASDQLNDQELAFKKRARRRLVGALALVLLMVTILPMVLDDKVNKLQQPEISITIPSQIGEEFNPKVAPIVNEVSSPSNQISSNVDVSSQTASDETKKPSQEVLNKKPIEIAKPTSIQKLVDAKALENSGQKKPEMLPIADKSSDAEVAKVKSEALDAKSSKPTLAVKSDDHPKQEVKVEGKANAVKPTEKNAQQKVKAETVKVGNEADAKLIDQHVAEKAPTVAISNKVSDSSFSLQLGVYSEAENVKKLQAQIQTVGYKSTSEVIQTAKGEKIRLKAGPFKTRAEAEAAESKIKAIGISTMIVTNK